MNMNICRHYKKISELSPKVILQKVMSKIWRKAAQLTMRMKDGGETTFCWRLEDETVIFIGFDFCPERVDASFKTVSHFYCTHYFSFFGIGWGNADYVFGACHSKSNEYKTKGVWNLRKRINQANTSYAKKIYQQIDPTYTPIDWQRDFKSGYRWSEKTWYKHIRYGHKPGVDIKVPWELARMQHLSCLAFAYGACREEKYIREFCNQVLDFIANNPPRFGVNWCCTMDVGIRVANWLVAYDLFRSFGAEFSAEFECIFANSVYDHGDHILHNLEYTEELRSNHYLSDIVGLLFVAAHLPSREETDFWLAFAVQELISEMRHEFYPDGGNFEASTSYHRLSTELMLYGAILCLSFTSEQRERLRCCNRKAYKVTPPLKVLTEQAYELDSEAFFPAWFWERLERAVEFTADMTKPNREVPQVGDNDSGRFLKIAPVYETMTVREAKRKYLNLAEYNALEEDALYYDEVVLNHRHICIVGGALFGRGDFLQVGECETIEYAFVEGWLRGKTAPSYHAAKIVGTRAPGLTFGKTLAEWESELLQRYTAEKITTVTYARVKAGVVQIHAYADFGLYIFKAADFFLSFRCGGGIGQNGNGGHAHNDQLSVDLMLNGQQLLFDPGTYVYTPDPVMRNRFRSTKAHCTPQCGDAEQNDWFAGSRGLFSLKEDRAKGNCLYCGADGAVGVHDGFGFPVYRLIRLEEDAITIVDFGVDSVESAEKKAFLYSNGYGKLVADARYLHCAAKGEKA